MGVLEDAIRDHLELKRKHGASNEEVQREEEESLGPARREFERVEPEEEPAAERTEPEPDPEAPEPGAAEPAVPPGEPPLEEPEPEAPREPEPFEEATEVYEAPVSDQPPVLGEQELDFEDEEEPEGLWTDERSRRDFDFD